MGSNEIYGGENEPWTKEDMFSWKVISLVCLDDKEGTANCGTVSRITIQREILHNHFTVPQSNSTKEEQATVTKRTLESLLCHETISQRYNFTPASQRHDGVGRKWTSPHPKHCRCRKVWVGGVLPKFAGIKKKEKEIGKFCYLSIKMTWTCRTS